ncbi:MAG: hypothetical protein GC192_16905 [Bacteroidetes bacterium]|nr:hypothetical protein [Bacteroidota bacterium]
MQVKTFIAKSVAGILPEIEALRSTDFQPNLAVVFCSINFEMTEISALFNKLEMDMVGASTAGEIVNENVFDGIITGFLLEINKDYYEIFMQEYDNKNPFATCKAAGKFAANRFKNPSLLVISGGVAIDAEQIVYGLKAGVGNEVPIFGGLAADDLQLKATYVLTNGRSSSNGVAILALDNDKIELKGLATSGWEGVGMENTITHAEGNIVYTINEEPAVNAFIKYFGYFNNTESKMEVSDISAQYPLQILQPDGSTVLRAPLMSLQESGALVLAGGVRNGDRFRFSIAPGFEVIDQTLEEFGDWKKQVDEADALILFSCKGRHAALGPLVEDEVKGIYDFWRKPMIGFFTYGEIGNAKNGVCEFHNETCSLVVLKERS